jgi:membrane associated rhomboid family serine protease
MEQFRPTGFKILPPVVKNLLIINGLFYLATLAFQSALKIDLANILGMHYFGSKLFRPYQIITYMFMHANFMHIFFNMFAFWMFGSALENHWGPKKFLIYFMVTGIGAILIQMLVSYIQITGLEAQMTKEQIDRVLSDGLSILQQNQNFTDPLMGKLNLIYNIPTIGASGAVFGVLLAFGMMFPNSLIYIYFAIPIKAKWFVFIYGALELYSGFSNNPGDDVAHFAHLGGMLFGFFLILYWNKRIRNNNFFKPITDFFRNHFKKKSNLHVEYWHSGRPLNDDEYNKERAEKQKKMDAILDKISKYGYDRLTAEEKEFLFKEGKKK